LYIHICTQAGYYWPGEIYLFCTTTTIIILHVHVTIEPPILQLISAPCKLVATMHFGGTTVLPHVPQEVALPFRSRPATGKRTRLPISGLRHLPSSVCLLPCAYHAAREHRAFPVSPVRCINTVCMHTGFLVLQTRLVVSVLSSNFLDVSFWVTMNWEIH
jgi:hypothetical protein